VARRIHDEARFVQTLARKFKYFDCCLVSLWNTPTEVWQIKVINKVRPVTARETQHQSQATPNLSSIAVTELMESLRPAIEAVEYMYIQI